MEGKQLKALIASIPRIVTKYFIDPVSKLFMEAQANWQNHNIFPNPETFWIFYQELEDAKLSNRDLAFLWCALHLRYDEISEWAENEDVVFPSEYLASILKARADHDRSILRELEGSIKAPNVSTFQHIEPRKNYRWLRAELKYFNTKETCKALYCFIGDSKGEGFEVFYTYDDPTYIRHVSSQANQEISGAEQLL